MTRRGPVQRLSQLKTTRRPKNSTCLRPSIANTSGSQIVLEVKIEDSMHILFYSMNMVCIYISLAGIYVSKVCFSPR